MNNDILEIPTCAGGEDGVRDSARVHHLLDSLTNPCFIRSVHA